MIISQISFPLLVVERTNLGIVPPCCIVPALEELGYRTVNTMVEMSSGPVALQYRVLPAFFDFTRSGS